VAETAGGQPTRTVVVPDREASLQPGGELSVEPVRAYRRLHPDHAIVSYINTSVEVKAESDILCTSRNAVAVVNSIPPEQPILFLPDRNLGDWVQKQTGRQNMTSWQGSCIVHATFAARKLVAARNGTPGCAGGRPSRVPAGCAGAGGFRRLDDRHHTVLRPDGAATSSS